MDGTAELLGFSGSFAFLGILGHVYIILCLILPSDGNGERVTRAINLTIGISSFMHCVTCCLSVVWTFFGMDTGSNPTPYTIVIYFLSCFLFSKVCMTSFLFLLYWSRIIPLRSTVLIRLMQGFSQNIHWVIAGSVLICFLLSLFIINMDLKFMNSSDIVVYKIICKKMDPASFFFMTFIVFLLILLPMGLMIFSGLSILLHLIGHLRRLRSEACEIGSPQVVQQRRAVIMLLVQLLLYSCYLCVIFALLITESNNLATKLNKWGMAVPSFYSLCTAANLISWNGFLRKRTMALLSKLQRSG